MNYRQLISTGLVLLLWNVSTAQAIPSDTAVRTGRLANGFTYYIRHNEEPQKQVLMYLVNNVGSVLEDDDQQGLAHFMEHMNFNGTVHFPKNELVDYLQKAGVRFGADLNAYTSFDETVFELPIPTTNPKLVNTGLEIVRDWAEEATLDSTEIEKERGVVLEERRLGLGVSERLQRQYFPVLLNHSRYAERIPIGKENILVHFPASAIRRFHHDWYRPDLQTLIIVGDIDVNQMEEQVKKQFNDLRNPNHERLREEYKVPLTGENHFLALADREMPATELQVIIKHPAPVLLTAADYIGAMKRALFNQMLATRYAGLSEESDPSFIRAGAGISDFIGGLDIFSFALTAKEGQLKNGFRSGWALIEQARRYGFTQTELDRAKQSYLSAMEAAFEEKDKTPSVDFVKEYQRLFLKKEAAPGISWEYQFIKNHIDSISLEDINAVSKDYISNMNRDILIMAPDTAKNNLPDSAAVMGWIKEISNEKMEPYKDEAIKSPLLSDRLQRGSIVSTKRIAALDITELTLSNGARIILKPTHFKNDQVLFNAFNAGGTCVYGDSDYQDAVNAAAIIGSFGVGNFTPVQLSKILNGKQVETIPYISDRYEGINGFTVPHDLETALQLVWLRFMKPRRDSILFMNVINGARDILASRYNSPENVFMDTMNYVLSSYNYRRSAPSVEKLNRISLQRAYEIYKDCFGDVSGFTFVFVGNFNMDSIRPLLTAYVGSLPGRYRKEKLEDRGIHVPEGHISKTVYKGTENKATVRLVFSGDYQYNQISNMQLKALAEVLQIKVLQHLREDESEVYSPIVQASYNKYPQNRYAIEVSFGCAPKNVDNLVAGTLKEIDRIKQEGADPNDVEKFKAEYRSSHEMQLMDNNYWLNYIVDHVENKEDMKDILDNEKVLTQVNSKSLRKAARQYLNTDNEIKFVLLPEK